MNAMGLEKLDKSMVKKIERQGLKDNKYLVFKKNWDKDCRFSFVEGEDGDMSFLVVYSYRTKQFYTVATMLNTLDEYDMDINEAILCNRMGRNTDFINSISSATILASAFPNLRLRSCAGVEFPC